MSGRSRSALRFLVSTLWVLGAGVHAQGAPPAEFSWRAPIDLPAGVGLARLNLPAQALMTLQTSDARDLRVFNAAGEVVPFALAGAPKADSATPVARTRSYAAMPLYSGQANAARGKGAVQLHVEDAGSGRSVWVQMDGTQPPAADKLGSVLLGTREERETITSIELDATVPPNTPVRIGVSTSSDLAQWTPEPVRGRIYRFEGNGAPANLTLEFERPLKLEGRYLRLDWQGQEGVVVKAIVGRIASAPPAPRVRGELPAPQAAEGGAVEIATGFATPLAALALSTSRDNTLLPIRVLGRNDRSQPWRLLGQTVVWRLGSSTAEAATNPPLALHGATARWLRLESTHGTNLATAQLQAMAEFEPLQVVFVASGAGPFELATGRAATDRAALPLAAITAALQNRNLEDLPVAAVGAGVLHRPELSEFSKLWPGAPPVKTAVLWAVLLVGVLLLAGVSWSLMRQLKSR